jgi:hypothetical protein
MRNTSSPIISQDFAAEHPPGITSSKRWRISVRHVRLGDGRHDRHPGAMVGHRCAALKISSSHILPIFRHFQGCREIKRVGSFLAII